MTKQQLREAIRKIIKQELTEALTPEEQQELEDIEYELRYSIQSDSAISPSMYKRYKELKAKKELKENMWAPEPEVADPDVEIEKDPLISPDEDEDDLRFPAPKGDPNPKAEREMIKKIIDRYNSLTENYDLKPISGFESTEKLMKSSLDRLATASQLQDWNLVDEVTSDIYNFLNKI